MTDPDSGDPFDALHAQLRLLADQLDLARAHVTTMEAHLEGRELARLGAHGFSLQGHLTHAVRLLDEISTEWADRSEP